MKVTQVMNDFYIGFSTWVALPADLRLGNLFCRFDRNKLVLAKGAKEIKNTLLQISDVIEELGKAGLECTENDFEVTPETGSFGFQRATTLNC